MKTSIPSHHNPSVDLSINHLFGRGPKAVMRDAGFSLVVTITMMVLLSMIAVALLSLSSTTLRSSRAGEAQRLARSNARLALMLAIGELQKAAGSDRRVTAPANIIQPNAPIGLTGAWESFRPKRDGLDYEEKQKYFKGWLVSTTENSANRSSRVPELNGPSSVNMVGPGTLGRRVIRGTGNPEMRAIKIPVKGGERGGNGNYAWTVMDEGVKARIDLPDIKKFNDLASRVASLGASERDAVWFNQEMAKFYKLGNNPEDSRKIAQKLISFPEAALFAGDRELLGKYRHDYTVNSSGLLTNVADGELKKDLSLLFDNLGTSGGALPGEYRGARLYEKWTGFDQERSTPLWDYLANYATTYKRLDQLNGTHGIVTDIQSNQTFRDVASTNFPSEPLFAPVVAKIEMLFSLVARTKHGPWAPLVPERPYLLHMTYAPVVTLYNPYNVPIQFNGMKLTFENIPIGFRFYRNGTPMTTRLASLNSLYVEKEAGTQSKNFVFKVYETLSASGRGGSPSIIEPGATRMFGINADERWTWGKDVAVNGSEIFDWRNNLTGSNDDPNNFFILARGWSQGMGFDIDWLAPVSIRTGGAGVEQGVIYCKDTDDINVEFAPYLSPASGGKFDIKISMLDNRGREVKYGSIEVNYGNENNLKKVLSQGTNGNSVITYPVLLERPVSARRIYEADSTPLSEYTRSLPFAVFSLRGKTTANSNEVVRSWVDSTPAPRAARMDFTQTQSQGAFPYELSLHPVTNDASNSDLAKFDIDEQDRGYYLTGHDFQFGTKVGAAYEVPFAPLQSIAQLRHANLSSIGRYPYTTYTIGESFLNAYLPSNGITRTTNDGYTALDHTWLANDALWDKYFFSTMCSEEGSAFVESSRSRKTVISDFFSGNQPLLNPRFRPLSTDGTSARDKIQALNSDAGYLQAAQFMTLEGQFNVNSTSVEAWKAVLAGLNEKSPEIYSLITNAADGGSFSKRILNVNDPIFPRLRRPLGPTIENASQADSTSRHLRWTGFRNLQTNGATDELEILAEAIVQQVKERGPFLSMSEFVNRRLAPTSDRASLSGAIQTAIELSRLNEINALDGRPLSQAMVSNYGYLSPEAVDNTSTTQASPGSLTQGDILSAIGSRIAVRSDTFTVRAYGDAVDQNGRVLSRAWCEAVVQRIPQFVNSRQNPNTAFNDLDQVNRDFGRRFVVTSFRWLSPNEI